MAIICKACYVYRCSLQDPSCLKKSKDGWLKSDRWNLNLCEMFGVAAVLSCFNHDPSVAFSISYFVSRLLDYTCSLQ